MNLMSNNTGDFFSLTLDHSEATYLSYEKLMARQKRVQDSFDPAGLSDLKAKIDEFTGGRREMTAMEFYLELEQSTILVLFHTLPRRGERNKHANGLQQTYGDHIRLMMLGFDMFDRSDIQWVMARRWQKPVDVQQPELEESIKRYQSLNLSRSEKVAVWITSALHDYGKIFRRGYGLDAEDAAPLCKSIVDELAPDGTKELIHFGIRNHDLIEHTVSGSTPAGFITEPLNTIPAEMRARALPMLALIQHIGAASLGEGRLSKAKLDIYNACFDGSIVADGSLEARLGRLLFGAQAVPQKESTQHAAEIFAAMDTGGRQRIANLLDRTVLHGWRDVREQIIEDEGDEDRALPRLTDTISLVAKLWAGTSPTPAHVVMARPHELVKCTGANGDNGVRLKNEDKVTELLNGAVALILR